MIEKVPNVQLLIKKSGNAIWLLNSSSADIFLIYFLNL